MNEYWQSFLLCERNKIQYKTADTLLTAVIDLADNMGLASQLM